METVVMTPQAAARLSPKNECPKRTLKNNEPQVSLALQETLQNWAASKPITTGRFTCKWQGEIPGVTGLLGGGWSSVSQR